MASLLNLVTRRTQRSQHDRLVYDALASMPRPILRADLRRHTRLTERQLAASLWRLRESGVVTMDVTASRLREVVKETVHGSI